MEKILNPYRLVQFFLFLFTWTGMSINGYDYDSVMLYANISLLGNLLLIFWNSGLISTKFILTFLVYSIAMVPGIAYYLLDFKLYSYVNFDHQLNDTVTIYMLRLMFMSSNLYTLIVLAKDTRLPDMTTPLKYETRMPFYFMCFMVLFLAYIGNPKQTLLSMGYNEFFNQRPSFANLASIAGSVFWVNAYGKMRTFTIQGDHLKVKLFWAVTFLMVVWLILHARRTEAIGVVSMLLIHQKLVSGKTPYKTVVFALLMGLLLYVIGYLRSNPIMSANIVDTLKFAFQLSFESGGNKTEFANMPSGLGNITATMQTSVYHFYYMGEPLLNGYTISTYPLKLLPTLLVTASNLADPNTYFYQNLVLENYDYNGGLYIYAPAYGNFGPSNNYIKIVFAASIIFIFIRVCWYNFLPLPKTILYNAIVLFYFAMIFNKKSIVKNNESIPQPI